MVSVIQDILFVTWLVGMVTYAYGTWSMCSDVWRYDTMPVESIATIVALITLWVLWPIMVILLSMHEIVLSWYRK